MHYGLTSSDVVDTALALQIQDAGRLVLAGIDHAIGLVVARAEEHRHTICIGRSHGIHAEPTTFGWKLAGWAFELDRDRARIVQALDSNRVGQLSGTVGTYAALDPEVERIACERLGLEPDPLSTQVISRDRHAELLSALAICATSLDRFATEIRHLARTEVREVEEPFAAGMKGSSAMPHKRNPKVAERISGLARVVRAGAVVGLENMPLWHERDISHSSAERIVIPRLVPRARLHARPLRLDRRRARRLPGADAAEPRGLARARLLAPAAARARRVGARPRRGLPARAAERDAVVGRGARLPRSWCEADDAISSRLDEAALAAVFDLQATVQHVTVVFERLRSMVSREAVVHV